MGAPDKDFKYKWETTKVLIKNELIDGKNIVLHCRGGKGRAATIAAILLVEFNYPKQEAIEDDIFSGNLTILLILVKKNSAQVPNCLSFEPPHTQNFFSYNFFIY